MKQLKQKLWRVLRNSGLLSLADRANYLRTIVKYYRRRRLFCAENPGFKVPPRALAFDAYSAPEWNFYKKSGIGTAAFLAEIAGRYLLEQIEVHVLEWGCGPARVIRHIPSAFGANAKVYGSDYNEKTIVWCDQNIPDVHFSLNGLRPPLPFDEGFFDFIYSISVFTHLSEAVSFEWIHELHRIMHSGAVAVISTNGDAVLGSLLPDELESYKSEGILIRGRVQEGKRLFSSFHSPDYLREKLFKDFEVLEFGSGKFPYTGQDVWVLRKP
jgi:SAM-dependent methyltransferase